MLLDSAICTKFSCADSNDKTKMEAMKDSVNAFDRFSVLIYQNLPGCLAQSVTCTAADTGLTADPGVASLILVRSHTFVEIDHETISTATLLHSTDSRGVVVSYKRKYVYKVLVNCLVKLARKKVW